MQRLLVTESGECFARFDDNSTYFLSSLCHILVENTSTNKQTTRFIDYINDEQKQKVRQIVNVRNQYFSPICFPTFMQQQQQQQSGNNEYNKTKRLLSPLTECIWTPHCIENETIKSSDGHTLLKVHKNGHQITIKFPLSIKKEVKVTQNGDSLVYYHHIAHAQTQSILNCDVCWHFPLQLIKNKMDKKIMKNVKTKIALPQMNINNVQKQRNEIAKISTQCMQSIDYFHCMKDGLPPNQIIAVEWTKYAVYRVFNCPNYLVEAFIFFDGSYLVSQQSNEFFHHFVPNSDEQKFVYSMNAVPPIPPSTQNHQESYNLNEIGQNALNLLQSAFMQTATKKDKKKVNILSNEIVRFDINPRIGEFTFYKDRRVKIHFFDRSLLELQSDWKSCQIITKYGKEFKELDCVQPMEQFEKYIQCALNYAKWASMSKREKLKNKENALKIQNDIRQQMKFCDRLFGEEKEKENVNSCELINSIQAQMDTIDKLLFN